MGVAYDRKVLINYEHSCVRFDLLINVNTNLYIYNIKSDVDNEHDVACILAEKRQRYEFPTYSGPRNDINSNNSRSKTSTGFRQNNNDGDRSKRNED